MDVDTYFSILMSSSTLHELQESEGMPNTPLDRRILQILQVSGMTAADSVLMIFSAEILISSINNFYFSTLF